MWVGVCGVSANVVVGSQGNQHRLQRYASPFTLTSPSPSAVKWHHFHPYLRVVCCLFPLSQTDGPPNLIKLEVELHLLLVRHRFYEEGGVWWGEWW